MLFVTQILKHYLVVFIVLHLTPNPLQALIAGLFGVASIMVNFFLFALFIQAIGSWFAQGGYNPFLALLNQVTEPLVAPVRKLFPPMSGFDFSVMIVATLLFFVKILFQL